MEAPISPETLLRPESLVVAALIVGGALVAADFVEQRTVRWIGSVADGVAGGLGGWVP